MSSYQKLKQKIAKKDQEISELYYDLRQIVMHDNQTIKERYIMFFRFADDIEFSVMFGSKSTHKD